MVTHVEGLIDRNARVHAPQWGAVPHGSCSERNRRLRRSHEEVSMTTSSASFVPCIPENSAVSEKLTTDVHFHAEALGTEGLPPGIVDEILWDAGSGGEVWGILSPTFSGDEAERPQRRSAFPQASGQSLMRTGAMSSHWASYAPPEFTTAADITPFLRSAFLWYADEILAPARECTGSHDFLKLRLFPSVAGAPRFISAAQQEQGALSESLMCFLRDHRDIAATTLLMGFTFLLGLHKQGHSWKNALEVPLTALQTLVNYIHVLDTQGHGKAVNGPTAREYLLLTCASLLVGWKYADANARVEDLMESLESFYFRQQHVLNVDEVLQLEAAVLKSSGLYVAPPRWWRVAVELLSASLSEENELQLDIRETPHHCEASNKARSRYEVKLEQLLVSSERVLLFVMEKGDGGDMRDGKEDGSSDRKEEFRTTQRPSKVHSTVCSWVRCCPLFGVALAVASGAVSGGWAAAHIAPAAGDDRTIFGEADRTARHELRAMAAVLSKNVLHPP
uniref:Uncharacterized protein n=1 Tax=Trypanosoma congolense (strain IL3000) TaxID=1068625 RepID=G0UU15_TRYCI|nr:conserved hypothetical protein [Trypanosoma congolense IL3000]